MTETPDITDAEFAEALAAATALALPDGWRGPLVPLDHRSDDDRIIATPRELRTRIPPLPFRYQPADAGGHDDAVVVGRIDRVWVVPGSPPMLWGEGPYDTASPYYEEAARQLAEGYSNRVSVDLVDTTAELRYLDVATGDYFTPPDRSDEDAWFALFERMDAGEVREVPAAIDWKFAAATQVAISAFDEAHIEPVYGYVPTGEVTAAPAHQSDDYAGGMVALLPAGAEALAVPGGDPAEQLHVTLAFLGDDVTKFAASTADRLREAITNVQLRTAAPIDARVAGYGVLGSEDPPATVLFLNGEGLLAAHEDLWGEMPYDEALPQQHAPWIPHLTLGYGLPLDQAAGYVGRTIRLDTLGLYLANQVERYPTQPRQQLAAAAGTVFPAAAFANPDLPGPTPWTVTPDGRVFGHLATWGVCHIGFADACVTAPRSNTDYRYFHVGEVATDAGALPVGKITLGGGHADARADARAAAAHYDNTCTAAAVVRIGEDEHGIWVAGHVLPGLTPERLLELSMSPLSGDWRNIDGNLELVAALAVNTPGFPIPRGVAASGAQLSLTAAGVLPPRRLPADAETALLLADIDERIARRVLVELAAQPRRRSRAAELARRAGRDPQARAAELAARIHQTGE